MSSGSMSTEVDDLSASPFSYEVIRKLFLLMSLNTCFIS